MHRLIEKCIFLIIVSVFLPFANWVSFSLGILAQVC